MGANGDGKWRAAARAAGGGQRRWVAASGSERWRAAASGGQWQTAMGGLEQQPEQSEATSGGGRWPVVVGGSQRTVGRERVSNETNSSQVPITLITELTNVASGTSAIGATSPVVEPHLHS